MERAGFPASLRFLKPALQAAPSVLGALLVNPGLNPGLQQV